MDLAQQYQQKSEIDHVLDAPDTYVGSKECVEETLFVQPPLGTRIEPQTITWIPGLYKLFDEAVVNARDHVQRMRGQREVTYIDVVVEDQGRVTVTNDGHGVDVAMHPELGLWIPELVFGHLRTSTNYRADEERIVGGKNGFGIKLVFIWSSEGYVETVDAQRGLKYHQRFGANLRTIEPPTVTKVGAKDKPYTRVSFLPDFVRWGLPEQTWPPGMLDLLRRRVSDVAATLGPGTSCVKVSWNGQPVGIKTFASYVDRYLVEDQKKVHEQPDPRWEYAVSLSSTHEFQQVSFVNGLSTYKGGKHVDYILQQLCRKLGDYIEKKKKVRVNPTTIKEQLCLFLRCDIVNPSFDSQTKDYLNTPSTKFGSSCVVSDAFVEKVAKLGVVDLALSLTEAKEARMAARKTDGAKTRTVRGIANFIDATSSGTHKSHECWLVLCEGLSAMSGIVSGLSSADRQTIGIYPLKGKLLNVRGESAKRISENKEITDIKKILGLEAGKVYKDADDIRASLRYGKVLLMTDQDVDGSHIKGLCINLFHSEWASLLHIPGFLAFMNTPILRARRGGQTKVFYHEGEYAAWKETVGFAEANKWTVKYFKGLGTSTAAEFKEYFANKKVVDLVFADSMSSSSSSSSSSSVVSSGDVIDKVFHKKRAEDRKTWLESYDRTVYVDTTLPQITYTDFVDKELIHFSTYDNRRSIPSLVDGLKPSQRKILYGAFVSGLEKKEQKVSEFSGYVSGNVAYHHGEASLNGAIVNMAQTFVGANNVPLLEPHGQFGTRMHGGDDSASERYIFTQLDPMTRLLFPADDDPVLTYLDDDGKRVEPDFFVPILPLVLVNGVQGIGTGFSTTIPPFHPRQLVETLRDRLQEGREGQEEKGKEGSEWQPFYAGFRGRVETLAAGQKWLLRGTYRRIDDAKVEIHELPVGTWTMPYLTFLDGLCDATTNDKTGVKTPALLKSFQDASTDCTVHITVVFNTHVDLDLLQQNMDSQGINGLEKALKLTTTVSLSNVHLFDPCCRLRRYLSVEDIVEAFVPLRLALYQKRKAYQVAALEAQLVKLENKARFVLACLEGVLDLRRKTSGEVDTLLLSHGFDRDNGDFKYLTKMPMDAVTEENVAKTIKEKEEAAAALFLLRNTSETDMWLRELEVFDTEYSARLSAMGKTKATQVVTTAPAAKKRKSSS